MSIICTALGHHWYYDRLGWAQTHRHCSRCDAIHVWVEEDRIPGFTRGHWLDWHTGIPQSP